MIKFRKTRRALSNSATIIIVVAVFLLGVILAGYLFGWFGKGSTSPLTPLPLPSPASTSSQPSPASTSSQPSPASTSSQPSPASTSSGYIFEGFARQGSSDMVSAYPDIITYYNSHTASILYWGGENDLPVLQLVPASEEGIEGVVFYPQSYSPLKNFTIKIIGTYTESGHSVGHGFIFYLFLNPAPNQWSVSPQYNNSATFPIYPYCVAEAHYSNGLWVLPESQTPYLMVMWDPAWGNLATSPNGGQWDVWIINNPNDVNASYIRYYGIGNNCITPSPADYIIISVSYNPITNTISGIAYDYNNSETATFSLNLNGLFMPPNSGTYVVGIGTGNSYSYADWTILYVNAPALEPLFSPKLAEYLNYV